MLLVALVAATLAALVHVQFFVLESLRFTRPAVWRRFLVTSQHDADAIRPMAFNQGWYNLFLALGVLAGVAATASGRTVAGASLIGFAGACMAGAGAVLLATDRRFARAAAVQAAPPLVALVALAAATL
ncbi:DUF1304 domain-containing protein [Couchioplanes caeruleus]|uniref:Epimerase n=2 Tax=Couchioplanes caeruleus TaxID=56438 RepID=A0A1K0H2A2_9ACTN|nr:DUF1304 domain-containing protein [Couchioplanes caeruleus]OJF15827.1 hypothetical protein BG844_02260 [Couchioplanes caeruleus subsp. caeruleus]ROP33784.1 putative membrane protein [Couchioplanes caeruleus]